MKKLSKLLLITVALTLVIGCGTLGIPKIKPYDEMTPKEKSIFMMDVYVKQFDDYMKITGHERTVDDKWIKTSDPVFTEEQKKMLKEKKKLLTDVKPAIDMYKQYVDAGAVYPNNDLESIITSQLNQLMMLQ